MYWKETKNFEDGCSSHIILSHYANGNLALPDQGSFIIEDTLFEGGVSLEANHHCNVGITGVLCMPQYILHNVDWKMTPTGVKWIIFQNINTQGHIANQNHGGIFTLSPPNAETVIGTGILDNSIFPPGFVSAVSSKFTYLLSIPGDKCILSSTLGPDVGILYDNGILCKVPLRSLKVYTRNLVSFNAPQIRVQAWFFGADIGNDPDSSQKIGFHQIGANYSTMKQGYSLPVVPGQENKYRLSLVGDSEGVSLGIPSDWVVEFSDLIVGNRWSIEYITLLLQGRSCTNNGLVNSHHDRRFLWSGNVFMSEDAWGNHGACVSSIVTAEDMPRVNCAIGENVGE